jgi:hypothetical protein
MQSIKEKIKQRRRQMLVHSYLYYELDENIVADSKWSKWAFELAELQKHYPKESNEVEYAELFRDWNGSSGADLKYDESIIECANRILALSKKKLVKPKVKQKVKTMKKSSTRSLF